MPAIILKLAAIVLPIIIMHVIKMLLNKSPGAKANLEKPDLMQRGAKIISKRTFGGGLNTKYFAVFEFADGYRTELEVPAEIYGLLAEDDMGILEHQHDRYIAFHRNQNKEDAAYKSSAELEE